MTLGIVGLLSADEQWLAISGELDLESHFFVFGIKGFKKALNPHPTE
jgi:hypothetical protein